MTVSPSDDTPLQSDRLDPRGTDWQKCDQDIARAHAANIRRVLDNRLGFAPDVICLRCREISALMSDPNMYIAVFYYLDAVDRRRFKEYLL